MSKAFEQERKDTPATAGEIIALLNRLANYGGTDAAYALNRITAHKNGIRSIGPTAD